MIRRIHREEGYLIDPHTAVGLRAAEKCGIEPPVVCLACAHPAKFGEAIWEAVGFSPDLPPQLEEIEKRETRCTEIEADTDAVRKFIETRLNL